MSKTYYLKAKHEALNIVLASKIFGLREKSVDFESVSDIAFIKFDRPGFGMEVTLSIRFEARGIGTSNSTLRPVVSINTPTTERGVANATAYIAFITEVNNLAATIQNYLDELDVTFEKSEV